MSEESPEQQLRLTIRKLQEMAFSLRDFDNRINNGLSAIGRVDQRAALLLTAQLEIPFSIHKLFTVAPNQMVSLLLKVIQILTDNFDALIAMQQNLEKNDQSIVRPGAFEEISSANCRRTPTVVIGNDRRPNIAHRPTVVMSKLNPCDLPPVSQVSQRPNPPGSGQAGKTQFGMAAVKMPDSSSCLITNDSSANDKPDWQWFESFDCDRWVSTIHPRQVVALMMYFAGPSRSWTASDLLAEMNKSPFPFNSISPTRLKMMLIRWNKFVPGENAVILYQKTQNVIGGELAYVLSAEGIFTVKLLINEKKSQLNAEKK
ncbi:MAG: hypothetical protein ACOZBH_03840 [Patescibacteria group bacterium]